MFNFINYDVNLEAVNSKTDDKMYHWETAAIIFIFLLIGSMICKIPNINMPQ
jgi:hypothetical protein